MKTDILKLFPHPHRPAFVHRIHVGALLLTVPLLISVSSSVHAAVTEAWVARYNNVLSNANAVSSEIVRDAAGDIIVAGYAGDGVGGLDMMTIKYSAADGTVLWQQRYNGAANGNDVVQAVAADRNGNIYVAGSSFAGMHPVNHLSLLCDYYIAKYASANGALLWEKRYRDPDANYTDATVTTLLVDSSGDVVLSAVRHSAKFAGADGTRLWLRSYPGVTVAAALDGGGNVVVTGTSFSNYDDIYTVKHAGLNGALLWARRHSGPLAEPSVERATALAVDRRGDVVVVGTIEVGRNYDWYAAKYAGTNGALVWERRSGGVITALAVDSRGDLAVTGFTTTGFIAWGWPVYIEPFTAKLAASNGALRWATNSPFWQAAAIDQNDNIIAENGSYFARYAGANGAVLSEGELRYPTGVARVSDGSGNVVVTGGRFETTKYVASNGVQLWRQQFIGPANLPDAAQAVVVDGSGNVIVTGSSQSETSVDYYTAKYAAANGTLVWEKRYDGPAHREDNPIAAAVDSNGNVVVTGRSDGSTNDFWNLDFYTAKYAAADGALLWEKRYDGPLHGDDRPVGMVVDGSGNVIVTGTSDGYTERPRLYTAKYAAADGTLLWENDEYQNQVIQNQVIGYIEPKALAVDGNGNVVTAGPGILVKHAATDGRVIWKFNGLVLYPQAMALDAQGNVALTGLRSTALNEAEFCTAKYAAADGTLLWEKRGINRYGVGVGASALAVDASGNVVVTGFAGGSDCYTAKYAAADGALIWERYFSLSDMAVAVDGMGDVILVGTSGITNGTFNYYTTKLSSTTGAVIWEKTYNGPANGLDFTRAARPLALGPNGIIAVTGYSSAFAEPVILFGGSGAYDYATVVYREELPTSLTLRPSGNQMILSWPTNATGFTLQTTLNLTPPVTWFDTTNPPAVTGAQFTATNPVSGGAQFFRLRKL